MSSGLQKDVKNSRWRVFFLNLIRKQLHFFFFAKTRKVNVFWVLLPSLVVGLEKEWHRTTHRIMCTKQGGEKNGIKVPCFFPDSPTFDEDFFFFCKTK